MTDPIFLFGFTTSLLELLSVILSIIAIWLTIKEVHWGWLFTIIASALYGAVFFGAKLYGDMALQIVFVMIAVWGWWQWLHGTSDRETLQVSRLHPRWMLASVLAWLAAFGALSMFLKMYTDTDVPYADGFLTAGSLLGQVLVSRKKIENWLVWIVVDVLYIGLYIYKNLMLTAILYGIFVIMAIIGWRTWRTTCPK